MTSSVGYEPKLTTVGQMDFQRRRATAEELRQGEEEMKKAEKRMKAEAESRGEKPIEDGDVGEKAEEQVEVRKHEIADKREDSKRRTSPSGQSSAAPTGSKQKPLTPPPTEPPKVSAEEFASPIEHPQDSKRKSRQVRGQRDLPRKKLEQRVRRHQSKRGQSRMVRFRVMGVQLG